MAKLTLTLTTIIFFFFFFLFSFSHARTSPEIDVINNDLSNTLPQPDTRTTILLPSNEPDPEPVTVADYPEQIQPETDTVAVDEPHPTSASNSKSFRPINRHYRGKRQFALGVPLRRCRHGHRLTNPSGGVVYPRMIHSEQRIPVKRVKLHHHRHQEEEYDDEGIERFRLFKQQILAKDKFERLFRHEQEKENKKGRKERSRGGGFVTTIRKFLNPK